MVFFFPFYMEKVKLELSTVKDFMYFSKHFPISDGQQVIFYNLRDFPE